jgi:ATP synthase protein I
LQHIGLYGMMRVMPDTRPQRNDADGNYARFVGLGITLLLIFALPTVVGFFLDGLAGTLPLFLLVGLAVGFVGGMYYVYRALQKLGG